MRIAGNPSLTSLAVPLLAVALAGCGATESSGGGGNSSDDDERTSVPRGSGGNSGNSGTGAASTTCDGVDCDASCDAAGQIAAGCDSATGACSCVEPSPEACGTDCSAGVRSKCACASSDPCGWSGNGVCDETTCAGNVAKPFDDAGDCNGGPSDCGDDCSLGQLTFCSCAVSDPCGWVRDGECDDACAGIVDYELDDTADCNPVPECREDGDNCADSEQCCDSPCLHNRCQECVAEDGYCTGTNDCCGSLTCDGYECKDCLHFGEHCSSSSDCCSPMYCESLNGGTWHECR